MCFNDIYFNYSGAISNRHNICLFAACFLGYSGGFSDPYNRSFNCPNPFLVQFPSPLPPFLSSKPITLVPNLFIYHLLDCLSKK